MATSWVDFLSQDTPARNTFVAHAKKSIKKSRPDVLANKFELPGLNIQLTIPGFETLLSDYIKLLKNAQLTGDPEQQNLTPESLTAVNHFAKKIINTVCDMTLDKQYNLLPIVCQILEYDETDTADIVKALAVEVFMRFSVTQDFKDAFKDKVDDPSFLFIEPAVIKALFPKNIFSYYINQKKLLLFYSEDSTQFQGLVENEFFKESQSISDFFSRYLTFWIFQLKIILFDLAKLNPEMKKHMDCLDNQMEKLSHGEKVNLFLVKSSFAKILDTMKNLALTIPDINAKVFAAIQRMCEIIYSCHGVLEIFRKFYFTIDSLELKENVPLISPQLIHKNLFLNLINKLEKLLSDENQIEYFKVMVITLTKLKDEIEKMGTEVDFNLIKQSITTLLGQHRRVTQFKTNNPNQMKIFKNCFDNSLNPSQQMRIILEELNQCSHFLLQSISVSTSQVIQQKESVLNQERKIEEKSDANLFEGLPTIKESDSGALASPVSSPRSPIEELPNPDSNYSWVKVPSPRKRF